MAIPSCIELLQPAVFPQKPETTKNTTISIFNTKKIRNLQFPSLITDFNFRLSSGNNNIILWAFSIPFTRRHTHSWTTITASGYTQLRKTKGIATTDSKYLPSYSSDLTVNVDCVRNNSSSELLSQQLSAIVPDDNQLTFKNNCVCRAICKLTSTLTNKQSITRFWLHFSHVHVMLYSWKQ